MPKLPEYTPESQSKWEDDETEDGDLNNPESDLDTEELEQRIRRSQNMLNDQEPEEEERVVNRKKPVTAAPSIPKVSDPYASDETSYVIPILVAICAFIPLLFCVCKL